jgi:hypothetical protein
MVMANDVTTQVFETKRGFCLPVDKRPGRSDAAGAFCCAETWQRGLLHRTYTPASPWVSKPLLGLRGFETRRFRHQTSGASPVAAVPTPDHHLGFGPQAMTAWRSIALFGSPCTAGPQNMDWPHEHSSPR